MLEESDTDIVALKPFGEDAVRYDVVIEEDDVDEVVDDRGLNALGISIPDVWLARNQSG